VALPSWSCGSCNSLIDLNSGVGGELRAAVQDEPVQPLIPLGSKGVLSLEQSRNEVTWSAGDKIASDTVAKAFKLDDKKDVLQRDDPGPFVAKSGMGCGTIILVAVVIIILLIILSRCSSCDPRVENCSSSSSYRSSGGSYGGYSSGGGHK